MRGTSLVERRKEMLKLMAQGVPLSDIMRDFSNKYGVSEQAIYMDWYHRKRWSPQIAQLNDPTLINELLYGLRTIIPRAWFMYAQSQNESVKIAALKLARETYLNIIEVLQSIGVVIKVPEKIEVEEVSDIRIYTRAIEDAINRDTEALRARKQVDTTPADTETS